MTIGKRLREERERLNLNQSDFAGVGGVGRKSQFNYEEDERQPDAAYLAAIAAAGSDVQYIVTGIRSDMALTPDERDLLALYRAAPLTVKASAIGALKGGSAPPPAAAKVKKQTNISVGINHGQTAGKIVNKKP